MAHFKGKTLLDFVTSRTMDLFITFDIDDAFTQNPVAFWKSDSKRLEGQAWVLAVVNDSAERGIPLIKKFKFTLTAKEEDKHFLLKAAFKHKKEFSESKGRINEVTITI